MIILPLGWLAYRIDRWRHLRDDVDSFRGGAADSSTNLVEFDATLDYVDLQPSANRALDAGLTDPPKFPLEVQRLGNLPFRIGRNYLQLGSKLLPEEPLEIKGISLGSHFDTLHALHATRWGGQTYREGLGVVEDGAHVGQYVLHYEDGQTHTIPLVYGEELRDWWDWDGSRPTKRAVVAWQGKHREASQFGVGVRLFATTWENPRPGQQVTSIDFCSANTAAAPFCLAITIQRK